MPLSFATFLPHPPLLLPGVGNKEDLEMVSSTTRAMEEIAKRFKEKRIDTALIITPHGIINQYSFTAQKSPLFSFKFGNFTKDFKGDLSFLKKIENLVKLVEEKEIDHGAGVPLFYLNPLKVTIISSSFLSREDHFNFGKELGKIIDSNNERVALIISGDLSHRLTPLSPAGFSKRGEEFDQTLLNFLKEGKDLLKIEEDLVMEAGECGYNPLLIGQGTLNKKETNVEILSYEGPFGVGYGVVDFKL